MTSDQAHALGRLIKGYGHNLPLTVVVAERSFDLPDGYITFRLENKGMQPVYGGISPEGDVST